MYSLSVFPDITKVATFDEKMLISRGINSLGMSPHLYIFAIFFK